MLSLPRAAALLLACCGLLGGCAPQVVSAGPPALGYAVPPGETPGAPPFAEPLMATDGVALPHRSWPAAAGPPRAVLLALHGFNEHSGNFLRDSVGALTAAGIAVHAIDQRGFGRAPARGYWPGTAVLVADATAAVQALRARYPGLPLYLMGESMGAAIALLAATADPPPPIDGLVLLAPAFWSRAEIGPVGVGVFWAFAHTLPALGFLGSAGGISASDNIEALRRNGRDPLVIKATRVDAAWGLLGAMDAATAALPRCCAMPALVLQGARDAVVPPAVTREALRRLPPGPRLARYAEGHHLLLRDGVRATVAADLLAWMAAPDAALPSGADAAGQAWLRTAAP